nr:MAG TPA: hypothetical protein [Caudoviricetes sp.]
MSLNCGAITLAICSGVWVLTYSCPFSIARVKASNNSLWVLR